MKQNCKEHGEIPCKCTVEAQTPAAPDLNAVGIFILFAGHNYYAKGGIADYRGEFPSIANAKKWFSENRKIVADGQYVDIWADIANKETMTTVAYGLIDESRATGVHEKWHKSYDQYSSEW